MVAYQFELKTRTKLSSKSLQEFAAAVEELTDWVLVIDHIQMEAA
jgi:hypothetical protein